VSANRCLELAAALWPGRNLDVWLRVDRTAQPARVVAKVVGHSDDGIVGHGGDGDEALEALAARLQRVARERIAALLLALDDEGDETPVDGAR
jgi:hypothetical protein